ncbi:vesicle-associated membrane protein 8-like [Entelurus aequoreus]|uniref:vesicle-associated membrane protein 8-like n=1 Tax=Entelurus aequoreus TaxID=161455 RepID=UPI002B1E4216|nr:vesicle-associated membrane protein 8-like [Entelurus aequoreus]
MNYDPEREGADPAGMDKVDRTKKEVEEVRQIMTQNMELIIEREEKMDNLVKKSEGLVDGADAFKKTSTKVARSYWWKNVKLVVAIVVIVLIIVLIIILLATGVIPVSAPLPPIVSPTPAGP